MAVKDTELTRLQDELKVVEDQIKVIIQQGQEFRKGGQSAFGVNQVKLNTLRAERSELRSKIATWDLY